MDRASLAIAFAILGVPFFGGDFLRLKKHWFLANALVFAMSIVAWRSGPHLFGRNWFYEAFPAGWLFGSLMDTPGFSRELHAAESRAEELEEDSGLPKPRAKIDKTAKRYWYAILWFGITIALLTVWLLVITHVADPIFAKLGLP